MIPVNPLTYEVIAVFFPLHLPCFHAQSCMKGPKR